MSIQKETIAYEVIGRFGASRVLLKPASPGTGVIAAGGVRAILEAAGVKNILTKQLGSRNPNNVVKATMDGLKQLRTVEEFAAKRGLTVPEVLGFERRTAAAGNGPKEASSHERGQDQDHPGPQPDRAPREAPADHRRARPPPQPDLGASITILRQIRGMAFKVRHLVTVEEVK